jgi:putative transposase
MTTGDSHNGSDSQHRLSDQVSANTADLIALARHYGRYGYRKIAALLRRAG